MKKVALALITDSNGRIFLQHRDGNAPVNPHMWGFWGGQIEEGESPDDAIVRELKEELDIDIKKDELVKFAVLDSVREGGQWQGHIYNLKDEGQFKYVLQEGDGMEYFTTEQARLLDTSPIMFEVLDAWESFNLTK